MVSSSAVATSWSAWARSWLPSYGSFILAQALCSSPGLSKCLRRYGLRCTTCGSSCLSCRCITCSRSILRSRNPMLSIKRIGSTYVFEWHSLDRLRTWGICIMACWMWWKTICYRSRSTTTRRWKTCWLRRRKFSLKVAAGRWPIYFPTPELRRHERGKWDLCRRRSRHVGLSTAFGGPRCSNEGVSLAELEFYLHTTANRPLLWKITLPWHERELWSITSRTNIFPSSTASPATSSRTSLLRGSRMLAVAPNSVHWCASGCKTGQHRHRTELVRELPWGAEKAGPDPEQRGQWPAPRGDAALYTSVSTPGARCWAARAHQHQKPGIQPQAGYPRKLRVRGVLCVLLGSSLTASCILRQEQIHLHRRSHGMTSSASSTTRNETSGHQ